MLGLDVDAADRSGRALLATAASNGRVGVVRELLRMGADSDRHDRGGWPPLAWAMFAGDAEAVLALLAAGAEPDAMPVEGCTVERVARARGHLAIASMIREAQDAQSEHARGQ